MTVTEARDRTVAIVQARMGSSRLPGKSMMEFGGRPLVELVLGRTDLSDLLDAVVLATSRAEENDVLCNHAASMGIPVVRGDEEDVLRRVSKAASIHGADTVVRICADNPLVSPREVDRIVAYHHRTGASYSFNHVPAMGNSYPDGLGAEVLDRSLLDQLETETTAGCHREHVTSYVWDDPEAFDIETVKAPSDIAYPDVKLDLDTPEDKARLEELFSHAPPDPLRWSAPDIVGAYRSHVM